MAADSSAFFQLDERIQRFIWAEGWEELREAQEAAIPFIVKGDRDVIVAAATAAGKTEAAFFPALTKVVQQPAVGLIVYISPLKALINDQFGRLERLCEQLELPVWPWHGDISSSQKTRFLQKRHGVLLITPESLEAMLCNRGSSVAGVFAQISYFVIDELHAFIGSERGKQLQSLMHRIETVLARTVPRIGLSATLGDMNLAKEFLRPGRGATVQLVQSSSSTSSLMVQIKGYEEPLVIPTPKDAATSAEEVVPDTDEGGEKAEVSAGSIASHLFEHLRGSNNLIFPNSRRQVELYTHLLNRMCEQRHVPNEFWPHHGSLSKEIRSETEAALKQKEMPATAVCTNTLELGIDIGAVKSVAQIGSPPTVASLRQRLGRSGRRKGEPAILRGYCVEDAIGPNAALGTELRLETLQMAAMVSLLVEGWFEPPRVHGAHLSTLVQQMLSVIAQRGGATIAELYQLLCSSGAPFFGVSKAEFMELVRHLGSKEMLTQDSSDDLLPGTLGEKFVNHYQFYAAFASEEEFRIVAGGHALGTLPVEQSLRVGERILFAGKTWRVEEVDEPRKTIYVSRTGGGVPPLFSGNGGRVHTKVRQRMREMLEGSDVPTFLDATAKRFLNEARKGYKDLKLRDASYIVSGRHVLLTTWLGDAGNEAVACLLIRRGYDVSCGELGVTVFDGEPVIQDILDTLVDAGSEPAPPLDILLADAKNLAREKWDWALPAGLLRKTYASLHLDLDEALKWAAGPRRQ
ncbi:MAG: DEAD/DEAH box helicase [Alphaproteobacteria bacterium]|nr:DEAD/DEAH box helicase [Alphaproteobacteria bacterium]MBU1607676.1 DEAD/DEAH box helicase [Alphaproteobacteria bacterium]